MTLDIEKERREFVAHKRTIHDGMLADWRESTILDRYADELEIWLAAKRAVLGSAEPAGEVRYDSVRGWHMRAMKDWASMGRGTKLYTAHPAPVSAEPVNIPDGYVLVPVTATNGIICAIEAEIDAQLEASGMSVIEMQRQDGSYIWAAAITASTPQSADAKDS